MKKKNLPLYLLMGGFVLIVLTPFILTQCSTGIDFTSEATNNIGGTIGGTTAPIIGVVSIFLIYFTYQEQRKSVLMAERRRNFDILYQLLKDTIERFYALEYQNIGIKGISYSEGISVPIFEDQVIKKGRRALNHYEQDISILSHEYKTSKFLKLINLIDNTFSHDLLEVINTLTLISCELKKSNILENEEDIIKAKLFLFYKKNLKTRLSRILSSLNDINEIWIHGVYSQPLTKQLLEIKKSILELVESFE